MRMGLRTHPKVVRIASALQADRYRVIGALHAVWCLADEHTEDGKLPGYSCSALDDSIGWTGFSAAMKSINWLIEDAEGLVLPRFQEHNGASAKRRAQEAERKRTVRKASASNADKKRTREREEKENKEQQETPPNGGPVWTECLQVLVSQNIGEKQARSFLGLLCREYEEKAIVDAVKASIGKANIPAYVRGVLKASPKKGAPRLAAV